VIQTKVTDELLAGITRRIVERFHPRRIVLFGSRARGDARPDSDIDLFIEMESGKRPPDRAIDILSLFGLRTWSMDVLVYTPEEVRRSRGDVGSWVASIEAEGRVLHEHP
jgi:predicted nucleotidyltransferase